MKRNSLLRLAIFICLLSISCSEMAIWRKPNAMSTPKLPNFVFILTDDLDVETMKYFPKLQKLMRPEGVEFTESFVTNAICCPSRATLLTGEYPHSHGIRANDMPVGGFEKFYKSKKEESTIATWLQAAGYKTVLLGKYLNHYPLANQPSYVPPGWTEWYGAKGHAFWQGFNYELIEKSSPESPAKIVYYGQDDKDYLTDVLTEKTVDFIKRNRKDPFYIYLSPGAPHQPATPAPRHIQSFTEEKFKDYLPAINSFDEMDVSDKPDWIAKKKLANVDDKNRIRSLFKKRLQSMIAVEEMVEKVIDTLTKEDLLDNTFIVFYSDNGFHLGQHRLGIGKATAYEEDIRVPFYIRGPGIPKNTQISQMVLNNDIVPTFLELAGVEIPESVEGRSLVPLLKGGDISEVKWRDCFLVEHERNRSEGQASFIPNMRAIRSKDFTMIQNTETQEEELYNLRNDPAQLKNLAKAPNSAPTLEIYRKKLARLFDCKGGDECSHEENSLYDNTDDLD